MNKKRVFLNGFDALSALFKSWTQPVEEGWAVGVKVIQGKQHITRFGWQWVKIFSSPLTNISSNLAENMLFGQGGGWINRVGRTASLPPILWANSLMALRGHTAACPQVAGYLRHPARGRKFLFRLGAQPQEE